MRKVINWDTLQTNNMFVRGCPHEAGTMSSVDAEIICRTFP
jgi:hypothetical protein